MGNTYAPFHIHSVYSLLDGAGQLRDYFKRAEELGLPSLGFSDHGNIHHVIDAYEIAKDYEVKYIPGAELYQARQTRHHRDELERAGKATDELDQRGPLHLSVVAQNMQGFKNLVKLSSYSWTEGYYGKPRVDHELLNKYGKGLIILSGCLNGELAQALLRDDGNAAARSIGNMWDAVGKENYYIEVMSHGIPEEQYILKRVADIASSFKIKIIPTIDSHYVNREDAELHDISLCLGTGALQSDENRFKFFNDQFYLKSYAEMAKLFPEEWLRNTIELNEKISAPDFELKEFQFPIYEYDGDHYAYLRDLTYKGLKNRYGEITKEIEDRVEYELGVIQRMGFVDYMLIVWDIIEWCHSNGIYASARGSAASAVVSYALGISAVDPIRFKLLFERFLIEGRKTMPDIDVDVDEDRREEVINYLRTKYGINRVANICNFSTIKPRSAIRDAARVLGYEYAVGDKLAGLIPPAVQGFDKTMDEAFEEVEELRKLYETDPDSKRVLDAAKGLEGLIRQTGVHAAGVLVTPGPLTDYMPIMQKPNKDGSPGPIITQWNGKQVESLGLLKIDILGLKNYSIIDKTLKSVKRRKNIDIDMDRLPLDDPKTYELLCSGDTTTIFQIGASGIANLTYEIQPKQIEDIMAVIALYRPGPLGSHMDKTYLQRKNGGSVTYTHPSLREAFEDTYGLMIYQEQILAVAEKLGGYSIPDRDGLRKLVGKKEKDKIKLARGEFVKRCMEHSHISQAQANKLFDEIEFFGAYGFNRGHSAAYAFLGFQTAYLKAHFPADYMAAVISCMDDVERAGEHVNNAKRLGLEVIGPSINTSERDFTVIDDETIQYGMKTIQGLGEAALDRILNAERDYTNLYDWLRRTHPELLNKSLIEHLLFAGALDELIEEQENKLTKREERIYLLNAEAKELGSYITEHPLKGVWTFLENDITHTVSEIGSLPEKTSVMIAGLVVSKDVRYSKRDGKMFIFFQVQDLTGTIDVAAFSQSAEKYKDIAVGDIVLMRGPISHERKLIGEEEAKKSKITLYECRTPQLPEYSIGESIELNFHKKPSPYTLDKILGIIEKNAGDSPVIIEYKTSDYILKYKTIKPTTLAVKQQLEILVLNENML